jgi:excisionase family DNA binding protein
MTRAATHPQDNPWLTVPEAAQRAKCGVKLIYTAIQRGRLRAVRLGARRDIRVHQDWVDAWMDREAIVVNAQAPGDAIPFKR